MKIRRPTRPRSASTKPAKSVAIKVSSRRSGDFGPTAGRHQLRPATVEPPMVTFAVAIVTGDGAEIRLKALMPESHRIVQRMAPRDDATTSLGAALPIVHVVLLERAARSEHPGSDETDRLLDLGWRRLVRVNEGPAFGLVGTTRVPNAQGSRRRPQD